MGTNWDKRQQATPQTERIDLKTLYGIKHKSDDPVSVKAQSGIYITAGNLKLHLKPPQSSHRLQLSDY